MRRRRKDVESFGERLTEVAQGEQAKALPPGIERDELTRKARQAETASHLNEWPTSPGLQPPKEARDQDLDADADEALEVARAMPPGPEKTEALKKAGLLRVAADARKIAFARRGRPFQT
jgi:hypothetical protein